jgi:hypothetical protein
MQPVTIEDQLAELRTRVDATEAVLAIQSLKARYADLVDRRFARGRVVDDALLQATAREIAATFIDDGVWDGGPALGVARGHEEIVTQMCSSTLTFSRHFFMKPLIEVHGDTATGRWDILSPCTARDGRSFWMTGFEDDVYQRVDGRWLHRSMKLTTVFMAPAPDGWGRLFA